MREYMHNKTRRNKNGLRVARHIQQTRNNANKQRRNNTILTNNARRIRRASFYIQISAPRLCGAFYLLYNAIFLPFTAFFVAIRYRYLKINNGVYMAFFEPLRVCDYLPIYYHILTGNNCKRSKNGQKRRLFL